MASSSDRFHKAAKDGRIEVLKEITRKDANCKDSDAMTPVLWAAFEGQLEALRLLCGRGGDPDKCDQFGNTALHLSAAKGHIHCVDFLIKFGVNLYALDIDRHSAKDLAAINNRDDILRYLDSAAANFEMNDRKKAKALKELAEKNCEKRMREYLKRQQRQPDDYVEVKPLASSGGGGGGMLSTLKQKIWSSQGNLNKCNKECPLSTTKFSELVGTSTGGGGGGSIASRTSSATQQKTPLRYQQSDNENAFKIGEIESDGLCTLSSAISGLQRDSDILYAGTFSSEENAARRGKIANVFELDEANSDGDDVDANVAAQRRNSTLSRSKSQPNFQARQMEEQEQRQQQKLYLQRPGGNLFERPMLGSIAFRESVTAALSNLQPSTVCPRIGGMVECEFNASRSGAAKRTSSSSKLRLFSNISDSDDADDSDAADGYSDDQEDHVGGPIQRFLTVWGLAEYLPVFQKQQIDLDTLMLLTEADLKSLSLPLGPFRKLAFGIQERRNALANPGAMQDSHL